MLSTMEMEGQMVAPLPLPTQHRASPHPVISFDPSLMDEGGFLPEDAYPVTPLIARHPNNLCNGKGNTYKGTWHCRNSPGKWEEKAVDFFETF